jgi:hypothetical protein
MNVEVETFADPLAAVRGILDGAEEALLGVAFVQQRGVNLLAHQLAGIERARLVTTTVFGSTTEQGLQGAHGLGVAVRVLNPARGTFHAKLYLARRGDRLAAAVGSANLTSGLIANVETVTVLRGGADAPPLRELWHMAESWWAHEAAMSWQPAAVPAASETLEPPLLALIAAAIEADPVVLTLADGRPNRVTAVTPDGVWVQTERSRALGRPPQLVEAWMIQVAWDWLRAHGSLTNRFLLADDGLNVKRSSFVCALLARLPGVRVTARRPITLALETSTVT